MRAVAGATRPRPGVRLPVLAAIGIFALSTVWVASQLTRPWGTGLPGWVLTIAAATVAGVEFVRAAAATSDRPVRRFWRRLSVAVSLMTGGYVLNAFDALAGSRPPNQQANGPTIVLYAVGAAIMLGAVLALPVARRSRFEWFTFLLDAATVLVASGLFVWHYSARHAVGGPGTVAEWSVLSVCSFTLVAMIALLRVGLGASGRLDRTVLVLLGLGIVSGAAATAAGPALAGHSQLNDAHLTGPVAMACWTAAAVRFRCSSSAAAAVNRPPGQPLSLLPYAAIAAVAWLLLVAGADSSPEGRIVVRGAVGLIALAVVRQLAAFYDNTRLLRQVDAGMLELRRHEQRFRSLIQQAADVILITTPEGRIRYASPALYRVLGLANHLVDGTRLASYIHPDDLPEVRDRYAELATRAGTTAKLRVRVVHGDGTWRWLDVIATNLLHDPSVNGIVSNGRDVTATLHYEDQLAYQATHDELTGLPNRSLLLHTAQRALAGGGAGVAVIDLDDFKSINDRLGHRVGDDLLVAVGRVLHAQLSADDLVARLGGDEFAVLLAARDRRETAEVLERLIDALNEPLRAGGYDLLVQASIGLADGLPGDDPAELLRRADLALYAAKENGKGRYARYRPELDQRSTQHAQIGAELRQALATGNQLHLLYQPIVTLPDGMLTGVEALIRWQHPTRGPISPVDFIPIAERTGLIVPLGRWILRQACGQAAAWARDPRTAPFVVSVNVSARQLRDPGFPSDVAAALNEAGLPPRQLTVEVTETAVFDSELAVEALRKLHTLGVRVALDDFGTGHSSLGLLRSCPVDVLKVDKSFIDGVTGTEDQAALASSMIHITSALRLAAVAEGVETEAQARELHRLGYRLAQGFHFARPLPAVEVYHRLLSGTARTAAA